MTQLLISLSTWLHALATVVFIGYYVLLALIFLPVLSTDGFAISGISKKSRYWQYAALVVFAITGVHLTFVDPNYLGLGDFGNPWAILMLVKHILIVAMVILGFWYNAILRVGPLLRTEVASQSALMRFRFYTNLMAISGVLVLLLTAFSQAR
jgi:uncharacterized membrane protein